MAEGLNRIEFTPKMRDEYTILIPNMAPIHFELMRSIFRLHGYKVEILQEETESAVEAGLRYVHNDICYPAIVVPRIMSIFCARHWQKAALKRYLLFHCATEALKRTAALK